MAHTLLILICSAAAKRLWHEIKPLVLDRDMLTPIFALNRRIKQGFRWNRKQLDLNPQRFRASDGGCWPRLMAA